MTQDWKLQPVWGKTMDMMYPVQPISATSRPPYPPASPYTGMPLPVLVTHLGTQTRLPISGIIQFNEPLVQEISRYREHAVPVLYNFLSTVQSIPALLEGLHTATRLAKTQVQNASSLYAAVSRWNTHPDPLVQIYLAGLYREIKEPATFGPMLATLVHRAVTQYPLQSTPNYNITEEVGGTLLQQIASRTADETVKRLLPFLQASHPGSNRRS